MALRGCGIDDNDDDNDDDKGRVMLHFKQTPVWKQIVQMVTKVYTLTRTLPQDERFGLTSQMRRAAVSVASNFAEGFGRHATNDFAHFLTMARGSAYELSAQADLVASIGYAQEDEELQVLLEQIVYAFNCILKSKGSE